MSRILLVIFMCFSLVACNAAKETLKPAKWVYKQMPKGPPEYMEGWQDGCESGMASMTNDFYKTFYTFKQNNDMIGNELYYKAWKDTFHFCRHYVYGMLRESGQRFKKPDEKSDYIFDNGIGKTLGYGGMPNSPFGKNIGDSPILFPWNDALTKF